MSYMYCLGSCIACNKIIHFNPNKVPSLVIDGTKEPLCANCHNKWNEIHRVNKGLEPVDIDPQAYEPQEV